MFNIIKRRKITRSFIEKNFIKLKDGLFPTYKIGSLPGYEGDLLIEDRIDRFCLTRGYGVSSYWIIDIEYIYQLKLLIKWYNCKLD